MFECVRNSVEHFVLFCFKRTAVQYKSQETILEIENMIYALCAI